MEESEVGRRGSGQTVSIEIPGPPTSGASSFCLCGAEDWGLRTHAEQDYQICSHHSWRRNGRLRLVGRSLRLHGGLPPQTDEEPEPFSFISYSESLSYGGSVLGAMLSLSGSRYIASLRNAIVWLTTTTNVIMAGSVSDPVMGFRP